MSGATNDNAAALRVFDFKEHAVRIYNQGGEPWFVAADVCRVLEIANPRDAVSSLDEDEKATVANPDGRPGSPGAKVFNIISESGLYALIFKSRKPEAKAFRKWVTQEVLPAIRMTGSYFAPTDVEEVDTDRAKHLAMREEVTRQMAELQEMTDMALHGVMSCRMRLSQARVIASLVGHRTTLLKVRMDLWAPERTAVDDAPRSGDDILEREREELVELAEAVWSASVGGMASFAAWQSVATERGLFRWLGGLEGPAGRSALGKLLRRWQHQPLGNGLALRVARGSGRKVMVELYRATGRRRPDMLLGRRAA
jgi:prophage antirepressor-like protein